jgi:hypothetical protein
VIPVRRRSAGDVDIAATPVAAPHARFLSPTGASAKIRVAANRPR